MGIDGATRVERVRGRKLFEEDTLPLPYGAALPLEEQFWDDLFTRAK